MTALRGNDPPLRRASLGARVANAGYRLARTVNPTALLVVMLCLPVGALKAQTGPAEDIATAEAFSRVCSDAWPERAAQFAASLAARQRCESVDPASLERLRASAAYREQYQTIAAEMLRMPDAQVRAFCETLAEARC